MSQFYDEFSNDAEREQNQCLYQYWKEFKTGKPLSYRERKREEYELSQGRLITVAYKGVMMHIDFETDLEKEYQSIINKQNKMKTSKIKSIQADGTWNEYFKFEVEMENGDVGGTLSKSQIQGLLPLPKLPGCAARIGLLGLFATKELPCPLAVCRSSRAGSLS